jgi:hypothetical protein
MSKDIRKSVAPKNASKKSTKVKVNLGNLEGGAVPGFAKGGSTNGCASRGHTKGKRA